MKYSEWCTRHYNVCLDFLLFVPNCQGSPHLEKKQGNMTSLSVDVKAKWGEIWETSEELVDILMLLSPLSHIPYHSQNKCAPRRSWKKMQSTSLK